MKQPLLRLTPHHQLTNNPLFALEACRVRWNATPERFVRRTLLWFSISALVVFAAWLVVYFIHNTYGWRVTSIINLRAFFSLGILAALGGAVLADISALNNSVRAISGEMANGRWDLLRISPLGIEQMIRAKVGAAQMRAWRITVIVVGLRLGIFAALGCDFMVSLLTYRLMSIDQWLAALGLCIAGLIIALTLVIEPVWRLRAAAALGVAYSAKTWGMGAAFALAFGLLLVSWLVMGVMALMGFSALYSFAILADLNSPLMVLLCALPMLLLFGVAVYALYATIARFGLRAAARWSLRR